MISIEKLMTTGVVAVRDSDTLRDAEELMRMSGIRHLPVSDSKNHVVGVISNRDISAAGPRSKSKRVGAVMSRDVKMVRPEDPARRAVQLMLEFKLGSVPVVNEDETLVGIVTETDFLRVAWTALGANSLKGTNHALDLEAP
jgi:CBS domain-containing membrane protein